MLAMVGVGAPHLRVGDEFAGKYTIERVLGSGGMGVVYAATHHRLRERVAIKVLHRDGLADPGVVERFFREAQAAIRIKSEHVARVMDVATLESGEPYLVLEHLEGQDLASVLETEGPLSVPLACELVLQACEALAEAHAAGIVHRDLKPANLFLVRRPDGSPCIKILDFGISKLAQAGGDHPTLSSVLMGSPAYMAPEQMRSARDVDARCDVWALGVVLHRLLTNELPFVGEGVPAICLAVTQDPPRPLVRADVPDALRHVVGACLTKDPAARTPSVAALAAALAPFAPPPARKSADVASRILAGSHPVGSAAAPPAEAARAPFEAATGPESTTGAWGGSRAAPGHARRWAAGGAIASLAAGIALVVGWLAWRHAGESVASTPSAPAATSDVAAARDVPAPPLGVAPAGESPAPGPSSPIDPALTSSPSATLASAAPAASPAASPGPPPRPALPATRPAPPGPPAAPANAAPAKPRPTDPSGLDLFDDTR